MQDAAFDGCVPAAIHCHHGLHHLALTPLPLQFEGDAAHGDMFQEQAVRMGDTQEFGAVRPHDPRAQCFTM